LIRAYLDYRHQGWMSWFKSSLLQESRDGASATEALLRTLRGWFSQTHFRLRVPECRCRAGIYRSRDSGSGASAQGRDGMRFG
jgi:hypothetical protein